MTPEQVITQLKQIQQQSAEALKKAEFTVINNIAVTAIGNAPQDLSQLIESIRVEQDEKSTSVIVRAPYAPYVEFGTGPYAAAYVAGIPEEWQAEALQFITDNPGHTAAHPFLFPAVQVHENDIYEEVDKELQKLNK